VAIVDAKAITSNMRNLFFYDINVHWRSIGQHWNLWFSMGKMLSFSRRSHKS